MCVSMPPACDNAALGGDDFGGSANRHGHTILDEWIPRVADANDASRFDADIRLDDSLPRIEDQRVRQDEVERFGIGGQGRLAHAVADDFTTAELHFIAIATAFGNEIPLHFDEEFGIGQAHAVANSGPKHFDVLPTSQMERHKGETCQPKIGPKVVS